MSTGNQGLVQKAAGCMDSEPRERAGLEMGGHAGPSEPCPGSALVLSVPSLTRWPEGPSPNAPRVAVSHTFLAQARCTSTFSSLRLEGSCPTPPPWLPPTFFRSLLKGHLNRILKRQHTSLSTLALSDLFLCFISLEHFSPSDIYLFI